MASLASASNFASDSFKTKSGKELIITFIKHGSLMLTYDNHSIQVDPVSEYADYTTFPKADIILITHEHGDHLDSKAISAVEKEGTLLITNASSREKLGKGQVMKNGDRLKPHGLYQIRSFLLYHFEQEFERGTVYHVLGRIPRVSFSVCKV